MPPVTLLRTPAAEPPPLAPANRPFPPGPPAGRPTTPRAALWVLLRAMH